MASVKPDVRIFEDLDTLSHAAADVFVESAAEAMLQRGSFLTALSGGSTPQALYQRLALTPYREQVDWAHTHFFWGDERCVPPEDLENTYRQVHDILLAHVPVQPGNIHRIRSDLPPEAAAEDYARVLMEHAMPPLEWPRFDLVLLGLGSDGHTASIFPGSDPNPASAMLAVTGEYQDRPAQRVTMTPPVFNSARRILFLVSGEGKSAILADVLNDEANPERLPAQRIRPLDGQLIWMVDQAAASRL